MEKLSIARAQLKATRESEEKVYQALIAKLDDKENELKERLGELNKKRFDPERANLNASDDDLVEINAGGKIVAAKRSVLTQLKGTRFEALFSGRWEEELQRDGRGRIFIDVNSLCLEAIVDFLNELAISSEDNPPNPPFVDDEHKVILRQYLELFGMITTELPESAIINSVKDTNLLHDWLEEDGSDGDFRLLYRSSRDGPTPASFHSKCDNQGGTLVIIETADGYVLGGYSNTPWGSNAAYRAANKAFLFVLSGSDISSPLKMKLKNANDGHAVYDHGSWGPTFGGGHDFKVQGTRAFYRSSGHTYEPGPSGQLAWKDNGNYAAFDIKEMEVFQVSGEYAPSVAVAAPGQARGETPYEPVTIFTENVNQAINARQDSLLQAEAEILHLEKSFEDEKQFIAAFATGETKDVVVLNVRGAIMAAKRSTLQAVEGSVLAQQFDDAKWTEQGCNVLRVKEWTPSDVASWANSIEGVPANIGKLLEENEIQGRELITLNMEYLKMLGVNRAGTLGLLLDEIEKLVKSITALIEHSPYCFGKILDYLRLKQLHSQGLVDEPALPHVCDLQKGRFEKVVQYYFPGDSAKLILG